MKLCKNVMRKGRAERFLPFCLFACLLLLASCSEEDNTEYEYDNWEQRNTEWFQNKLSEAQAKISSGNRSWCILRSYTKGDTVLSIRPEDHIIVEKLDSIDWPLTDAPLYTDTVAVHYRGWLIPSVSYQSGYQFDSSYLGTFDEAVATPYEFSVKSLTAGFATAVMHMRRGDRWRVYIPYQLGYGSAAHSGIPAYSNLVFDIRLVDFWK